MANREKRYALAIDTRRCIDCKSCVVACRAENGVPLPYSRNWIDEHLDGNWPKLSAFFEPGQCNHCDNPPCVHVCPTGATYKRPDGIVAINARECIGCGLCMQACPYHARFFREDLGVVEKCDYCAHRLDRGELPACVETCPGKVRVFGDLQDPESPIHALLQMRQYRVKKPEAGTGPQTYYLL